MAIAWYDSNLVLLDSAPSFIALPGIPSAAQTFYAINNKDGAGAQTELNLWLEGRYRNQGTATPPVGSGHPWADGRYMEARIAGGWNLSPQTTDWIGMGAGAILALPDLGNDEGIKFEFRLNPEVSADDALVEFFPTLMESRSIETGISVAKALPDGVVLGLRDAGYAALLECSAVVQNPAGADDDVLVPTVTWIEKGIPYRKLAQLVNCPAAAASNSRYDLLSLGGGVVVRTAGTETTDVLDEDDKPALPAGNIALAYVTVDSSGVIQDADIEQVWEREVFALTDHGDLTPTLGPGSFALVDGATVYLTGQSLVPLEASATNYIWLLRTGRFDVTADDPEPPNGRALLLYECDTDVDSITAIRDRRYYLGFDAVELVFRWDGVLVDETNRYYYAQTHRGLYLVPVAGAVRFALGETGSLGSAGSTILEIEADNGAGGAFTSIFSGAEYPEIAYNAASPFDAGALPTTLVIPPGARLRARVTAVPTGDNAEDGVLVLLAAR